VVKTSGSLKLRDEICVEAGAISLESINNGAPVNSSNHRINGDYDRSNYDSGLDSPRQMIDKTAGQTTRMSEYYGATRWKSMSIVCGYSDQNGSGTHQYKPVGINAHGMAGLPNPFTGTGAHSPGFGGTFGTSDCGFSTTRGEVVDLTRLIGLVIYAFPSMGTPYVVLYHYTHSQLLTNVLKTQSKEWGNYFGHLMIRKIERNNGSKSEYVQAYTLDSKSHEENAGCSLKDGTPVHRLQWSAIAYGPDDSNLFNLDPGDKIKIWFDGVR